MKYVIEDTTLTGIADAIREKTETTEDIPVTEMRPKILGIAQGMTASIFVTGLSESDTVTATKDGKIINGVWTRKINVIDREIPTMTSATAPSGTVTASSQYSSNFAPYMAFNGVSGNGWAPSGAHPFGSAYVQYDFGELIMPTKVGLCTKSNNNGTHYFTFQVRASKNNSEWDVLIESKTLDVNDKFVYIDISTDEEYRYYRLVLMDGPDLGASNGHKMQVYGEKYSVAYGHKIANIGDKGMWTVTATNDNETATQDVLVDGAFDYEIEMEMTA